MEEELEDTGKPFFVASVALPVSSGSSLEGSATLQRAMEDARDFLLSDAEARGSLRAAIAGALGDGVVRDMIIILDVCVGRCTATANSGARFLTPTDAGSHHHLRRANDTGRELESTGANGDELDVQYAVVVDDGASYGDTRLSTAATRGTDALVSELQLRVTRSDVQGAVLDSVVATLQGEDTLESYLVDVPSAMQAIIEGTAAGTPTGLYQPLGQQDDPHPSAADEEEDGLLDKLTTPLAGAVGGVVFVGLLLLAAVLRRRRKRREKWRCRNAGGDNEDKAAILGMSDIFPASSAARANGTLHSSGDSDIGLSNPLHGASVQHKWAVGDDGNVSRIPSSRALAFAPSLSDGK